MVTKLWLSLLQFSLVFLADTQIIRLACRKAAIFGLQEKDHRVTNGIISSRKFSSLFGCNNFCLTYSSCESINFQHKPAQPGQHSCELIGKISTEIVEFKFGWSHYKPLPEGPNRCKVDSCPVNYRCQDTCDNPQGYKCTYISQCLSSPCKNGATCTDNGNGFVCNCVAGYVGKTCDKAQTCSSGCMVPVCNNLGNGVIFTTEGRTGRVGNILDYTITSNGNYQIKAAGAKGGTHNTSAGDYKGVFCGGNGAAMQGNFPLTAGTILKIVVGHRGGNSVEISGGQATTATAESLGKSIEDNAGTGGGGGSFVYTSANVLLIAAGGGGGATAGWNGVDGSNATSGTDSIGNKDNEKGTGGSNGQPGQCCSTGSYPGGTGAGWLGQGAARSSSSHGEGGGSRTINWVGGNAGNMNSGNNGGPAPGAVGGFGGGGGGSEDNGASGAGGGYSGGGSGTHSNQAGGGGGSFCNTATGSSCYGVSGGNDNHYGYVIIVKLD